jgi:ADP-heptose:LPS heptosyltransferase
VEIVFEAVRKLGYEQTPMKPQLFPSIEDRGKTEALLPSSSGPVIGFHIGAGDPTRLWGSDRYAEVMNLVRKKYEAAVVIVGGKTDSVLLDHMRPMLNFTPVNLLGLSITESAAAIEKCDLFIGNNSSQIHVAAAVGTPVIVLHTTSLDSRRWGAFGENVSVMEKVVSCSYCEKRKCDDMRCMHLIAVDEVMENIDKTLRLDVR